VLALREQPFVALVPPHAVPVVAIGRHAASPSPSAPVAIAPPRTPTRCLCVWVTGGVLCSVLVGTRTRHHYCRVCRHGRVLSPSSLLQPSACLLRLSCRLVALYRVAFRAFFLRGVDGSPRFLHSRPSFPLPHLPPPLVWECAMATPTLLTPSRMRADLATRFDASPPRGRASTRRPHRPHHPHATPPPVCGSERQCHTPPTKRSLFTAESPSFPSGVSPVSFASSSASALASSPYASSTCGPTASALPSSRIIPLPLPSRSGPSPLATNSSLDEATTPATHALMTPPGAVSGMSSWTMPSVVVPPPGSAPPPAPPPSSSTRSTPPRRNRPVQRARPALRVLGEPPLVAPVLPVVMAAVVPVAPLRAAALPRASHVVSGNGRAARAPASSGTTTTAAAVPPKPAAKPVGPVALGPKAPPPKGLKKGAAKGAGKSRAPSTALSGVSNGASRPAASVSHGAVAVAFAGCTFESASPAPSALPLPSFGGSSGKVTERFGLRRHVPCG